MALPLKIDSSINLIDSFNSEVDMATQFDRKVAELGNEAMTSIFQLGNNGEPSLYARDLLNGLIAQNQQQAMLLNQDAGLSA